MHSHTLAFFETFRFRLVLLMHGMHRCQYGGTLIHTHIITCLQLCTHPSKRFLTCLYFLLLMASDEGGAVQPAQKTITVGIDFGTYGSGFAFASRSADGYPDVLLHEAYPGMSSEVKYPKTRTAVLYKGRYVLHADCVCAGGETRCARRLTCLRASSCMYARTLQDTGRIWA